MTSGMTALYFISLQIVTTEKDTWMLFSSH